jgi:hypothetical protein
VTGSLIGVRGGGRVRMPWQLHAERLSCSPA